LHEFSKKLLVLITRRERDRQTDREKEGGKGGRGGREKTYRRVSGTSYIFPC
jgi:hypothetical protein